MTTTKSERRDLVEDILQAKTAEDIHAACVSLCERYGVDCFHYGAQIPTSLVRPAFVYVSGFPSDWWTRYNEQNYMRVDPIVTHTLRQHTPLLWDCESELADRSVDVGVREFMQDAMDFGLRKGATFPVHGANGEIALLSFVLNEHSKNFERNHDVLFEGQLFSAYVHEAVRRVFGQEFVPIQNARLTGRETECLKWTAEGKTTWEIAAILGISERTVIFHLQNVSEKLNASNRSHAVARAISRQIILPDNL